MSQIVDLVHCPVCDELFDHNETRYCPACETDYDQFYDDFPDDDED